jgi:hypothetical protein
MDKVKDWLWNKKRQFTVMHRVPSGTIARVIRNHDAFTFVLLGRYTSSETLYIKIVKFHEDGIHVDFEYEPILKTPDYSPKLIECQINQLLYDGKYMKVLL